MPKNLVTISDLHQGRLRGVACTFKAEDGVPLILSGGEDRDINMSNADNGDFVRKIPAFTGRPGHPGHTDKIYAIQLWTSVEDGKTYIVSSGDDLIIRIMDLEATIPSFMGVRTMAGHTQYVHTLVILESESRCVSASYDRSVRFWDLLAGEQLRVFSQEKVLFAFDVCKGSTHFATGSAKHVLVWDTSLTTVLSVMDDNTAEESSVSVASTSLASESESKDEEDEPTDPFATLEADGGRVIVPRRVNPPNVIIELRSHVRTVVSLAFPRLDRLITASDDATMCVWNPQQAHSPLLEKIDTKTPIYVMKTFFDGSAFLLITGSWGKPFSVRIWNLEEKEKPSEDSDESEEELDSDEEPEPKEMTYCYVMDVGMAHQANVVNLAILDDGKPHVVKEKRQEGDQIDIKRIASISWDGTIRTWDLRPAIEVVHRTKFTSAAQTSRMI